MKEKVLFVYDSMMTGGTTTALLSLINTIDREKYDLSLVLYSNDGDHINDIPNFVYLLKPAYKKSKLPFLNSSVRKIFWSIVSGRIFKAIITYFKYRGTVKGNFRTILMHYGMKAQVSISRCITEHFDVAIGFMEGWADQYVLSNKINSSKKFIWYHPEYENCYLIPEIDRVLCNRADGIVLIAENCLGQFIKYFPEYKKKIKIVPNIMSTEMVRQRALSETVDVVHGRINFCTVCRCDVRVKGLDRMLKALHKLKEEGLLNDVKWHLIGDGKDFISFKNSVEELGLTEHVVIYGSKLNPLPYLLKMDVFVLGSRYEGKPVAVTEAQMLGLPCLVTNYASAQDQVSHGYNGIIVSNDYEGVYNGIKKLLVNPELIDVMKEKMKNGKFSNESDVEKFYDILLDNNQHFNNLQ